MIVYLSVLLLTVCFTIIWFFPYVLNKDFTVLFYDLIRKRRIRDLLLLMLCFNLFVLNRALIVIEDYLFPHLLQMEVNLFNKPNDNVVMIIGHPRSGTTNV